MTVFRPESRRFRSKTISRLCDLFNSGSVN
jgi:hypothetical protein